MSTRDTQSGRDSSFAPPHPRELGRGIPGDVFALANGINCTLGSVVAILGSVGGRSGLGLDQGRVRTGALMIGFAMLANQAWAQLNTESPLGFFTNVAARFLKAELNLELSRIQVWPTNQYTPAVHRLLQVSANLLDATTNRFNAEYPYLPSVFRPVFTNDGSAIFIGGYLEENGNAFTNQWRDLSKPAERAALQGEDYVSGIPLVIGAKAGFPNFNEFAMQSVFQITRKLQMTKPNFTSYGTRAGWQTNLMFVVGISNSLACELWNSYCTNYPRDVDIHVDCEVWITLTNGYGLINSFHETITHESQINSNDWAGWANNYPVSGPSFVIPLMTNSVFLPDSVYRSGTASFTTNLSIAFEPPSTWPGGTWPLPQWELAITNRLRCALVDRATGRLIDVVQFDPLRATRNLSLEIQDPDNATGFNGLWSTNQLAGGLPRGVYNQLDVSLGNSGGATTDWSSFGLGQPTGDAKRRVIDLFRVFYGLSPIYFPDMYDTNLAIQVPFTPTARTLQYVSWQANDPLVNALAEDISFGTNLVRKLAINPSIPSLTDRNIGVLNDRFDPWGGSYPKTGGLGGPGFPNAFNLGLKDAGVLRSDHWRLTNSAPLSVTMLGRVHRGTPWQTIHLKSSQVDPNTWRNWTGCSLADAPLTMPVNDWRLASLLISLLNTNSPHQLLSVNERSTEPWLTALDGIDVITNLSATSSQTLTMYSNSPQAAIITEGIRATRASLTSQTFRTLGDVLAVPELSAASPWLNAGSSSALKRSMTDEAYEIVPSQLLACLRPDSLGTITLSNGLARLEFTGFDGYAYAVQSSSNLISWSAVCTNWPTNGVFTTATPQVTDAPAKFYRSALLP